MIPPSFGDLTELLRQPTLRRRAEDDENQAFLRRASYPETNFPVVTIAPKTYPKKL